MLYVGKFIAKNKNKKSNPKGLLFRMRFFNKREKYTKSTVFKEVEITKWKKKMRQ